MESKKQIIKVYRGIFVDPTLENLSLQEILNIIKENDNVLYFDGDEYILKDIWYQ